MQTPQGEGEAPPPQKYGQKKKGTVTENEKGQNNNSTEVSQQQNDESAQKDANNARSSTCKPVATDRPKVEFPSHRINARIQFMRDHALISKFIGIWPIEKALRS